VKKYGCIAGPASVIPPEVARDSSSRTSTEGVAYRYARLTGPVRLIARCYRPALYALEPMCEYASGGVRPLNLTQGSSDRVRKPFSPLSQRLPNGSH
jgi:hypothetical protein